MERGEGRNRSEIPDLDRRLKALDEDLVRLPLPVDDFLAPSGRAWLFTFECFAATLFLRLRAELFEARLGMPKNDADVFAILQREGRLGLAEARQIRQFCEARNLSARDLEKLDVAGLAELSANRTWILETIRRFSSPTPATSPGA